MTPLKKAIDLIKAAEGNLFSGEFPIGLCTYEPQFDEVSIRLGSMAETPTEHMILVSTTPEQTRSGTYFVYINCDITESINFSLSASKVLDFLLQARLIYPNGDQPLRVIYTPGL